MIVPNTPTGAPQRPARRRLVTAAEAADMLALPMTSLYGHARAGTIPGVVRIGRRVQFDLDVLNVWLDAGGEHPQEQA